MTEQSKMKRLHWEILQSITAVAFTVSTKQQVLYATIDIAHLFRYNIFTSGIGI